MTDEQAFLDLLVANPADRQTRLIYADWLEERGDPRAALLRLNMVGAGKCPVCASEVVEFDSTEHISWSESGTDQYFAATCHRCHSAIIACSYSPNEPVYLVDR